MAGYTQVDGDPECCNCERVVTQSCYQFQVSTGVCCLNVIAALVLAGSAAALIYYLVIR